MDPFVDREEPRSQRPGYPFRGMAHAGRYTPLSSIRPSGQRARATHGLIGWSPQASVAALVNARSGPIQVLLDWYFGTLESS